MGLWMLLNLTQNKHEGDITHISFPSWITSVWFFWRVEKLREKIPQHKVFHEFEERKIASCSTAAKNLCGEKRKRERERACCVPLPSTLLCCCDVKWF